MSQRCERVSVLTQQWIASLRALPAAFSEPELRGALHLCLGIERADADKLVCVAHGGTTQEDVSLQRYRNCGTYLARATDPVSLLQSVVG